MPEIAKFDERVGQIAGAIYWNITPQFPHPPRVLIPGLTLKVRKILERATDVGRLSDRQKIKLAKDIQTSIVPMLFSYEIDASLIDQIEPAIASAAYKALREGA